MNSTLTPEEKLDVMAAMIEGHSDNEGKRASLARMPNHVRNALKKAQPTANEVNVGDLRQKRLKQSVRPRSALYHPQPPAYQTVQQIKRPLSAQDIPYHVQSGRIPSSMPSPLYQRAPDVPRQRVPYPLEMYDPHIRYPYPFHQPPHPLRYKVPGDFYQIAQQRQPPEIIPVVDASPGALYADP